MVRSETETGGTRVYYCEICGLGYAERRTAVACEEYCSNNSSCSLDIISKSIRRPK